MQSLWRTKAQMLTFLLELQELDSIMKTSRKTLLVMVHSVTNTMSNQTRQMGEKNLAPRFLSPRVRQERDRNNGDTSLVILIEQNGFSQTLKQKDFFKDWVTRISCVAAVIIGNEGKWSTKEGSGLKIEGNM